MRRLLVLTSLLVLVVTFGGAAAWIQRLHNAPKASEFDCLSTAHTGWLTVSAGDTTVHADWDGSAGRVDGVPGMSLTRDEVKARSFALDVTSPLKGRPSGSRGVASVHIFALCDGVPRWWSGTTVMKPSLKECVKLLRPRALIQCVRDVAESPAPAPTSSEAYDVAAKVWKAVGVHVPAPEPEPPPGTPMDDDGDDDSLE
jgi:hypothetical protein